MKGKPTWYEDIFIAVPHQFTQSPKMSFLYAFSFVFLFGLPRRLPHGIFLQGNFTGNNWLPRRVETTSP